MNSKTALGIFAVTLVTAASCKGNPVAQAPKPRHLLSGLVEVRQRIKARTDQPNTERDELDADAKRLRTEIDRLASGVESATIATVIGQRGKRLTEVRARLEVITIAPSVLDLEVRRLEQEARTRLAASVSCWSCPCT